VSSPQTLVLSPGVLKNEGALQYGGPCKTKWRASKAGGQVLTARPTAASEPLVIPNYESVLGAEPLGTYLKPLVILHIELHCDKRLVNQFSLRLVTGCGPHTLGVPPRNHLRSQCDEHSESHYNQNNSTLGSFGP